MAPPPFPLPSDALLGLYGLGHKWMMTNGSHALRDRHMKAVGEIRPGRPEDAKILLGLEGDHALTPDPKVFDADVLMKLTRSLEAGNITFALWNDKERGLVPAGYIEVTKTLSKRGGRTEAAGPQWTLDHLFVSRAYRQQTVGRQLLFYAMADVTRERGHALQASIPGSAFAFFKKAGVRINGREDAADTAVTLPTAFVPVRDAAPRVHIDLRYAGSDNFVGRPIDGYEHAQALLTREAATALARAQSLAQAQGFSIKVFDTYRPQRAVDAFYAWSHDHQDDSEKQTYYPRLNKSQLFPQEYIALRSGHSRGSTLDCTLVYDPVEHKSDDLTARGKPTELDMGTVFDAFDERSHTASSDISAQQRANRKLFVDLMHKAGFENYHKEWWHFTLREEPYPDTYFDFLP